MLQSGCDRIGASARCLQSWQIHLRRLATAAEHYQDRPHSNTPTTRQRRGRAADIYRGASPVRGDAGHPSFAITRTPVDSSFNDSQYRPRASIPFENFRHVLPQQTGTDALNTTVTRREGRAFKKLQDLRSHPSAFSETPTSRPPPSNQRLPVRSSSASALDHLLDSIQAEASGAARATSVKRSSEPDRVDSSSVQRRHEMDPELAKRPEWRLDDNNAYSKTVLDIQSADSDLEIWQILQRDVFKPAAQLHLDGPSEQVADFPTIHSGSVQVDALRTIGTSFAQILIVAAEALKKSFPTSPVQTSLIPELRKLGPSYFALGVTTELYNYALSHAIKQDQDLSAGLDILDEMDREVIEPNEKTLEILRYITQQARRTNKGEFGHGVRLLWQTERNRTALKEFRHRMYQLDKMFNGQQGTAQYNVEAPDALRLDEAET
ncbi:hypothetical protein K461DRAFT_278999 [Myriangium duriaei CBS 260.36]|uniref:Mtf2-like C-terminal domain-containing protein n=1 Tax=Myriangium duriaei CBS 260.36 TaxID=1168546 RepID=A0A9P4J1M0_9PEZI|nr:hypothetical protein K461DRAFT_278999 [Myriangium duriaei CBS 260.36]